MIILKWNRKNTKSDTLTGIKFIILEKQNYKITY